MKTQNKIIITIMLLLVVLFLLPWLSKSPNKAHPTIVSTTDHTEKARKMPEYHVGPCDDCCEEAGCGPCKNFTAPTSWELTVTGFSGSGASCGNCANINGIFELINDTGSGIGSDCGTWSLSGSYPSWNIACDTDFALGLFDLGGGIYRFRLQLSSGPGIYFATYELDIDTRVDCMEDGPFTLELVSSGGMSPCPTEPATLTLEAVP